MNTTETTVSCLVELQEPLHEKVASFLESRPDWDCDRVFNTAISLFLLQSHPDQIAARQSARIYVEEMLTPVKRNGHQPAP